MQGYLLLIATVNGFTVDETGVEDSGAPDATTRPRPGRSRGEWPATTSRRCRRDLFPNMTSLASEFALADPDERFELLLDIFVDGLARRAAAA